MKAPLSCFCVLLFAVAMSACAARQHPEPADPVADAETLLGHIDERAQRIQSARVRAVMEYFGGDGRVRVRQLVVVQEPGDLRLETMSPFDATLALVVTNEDDLTYYDLGNDLVYVGAPTAENLAKLIPLWLEPADIVDVVLGGVPLGSADHERSRWKVAWDGRANAWRLFGRAREGGNLELLVRHGTWSFAGARETNETGDLKWEIRTADFTTVEDGETSTEVPMRVRFLMESEGLDVSLAISEYELNPELDDLLFEIFTPDHDLIQLD